MTAHIERARVRLRAEMDREGSVAGDEEGNLGKRISGRVDGDRRQEAENKQKRNEYSVSIP